MKIYHVTSLLRSVSMPKPCLNSKTMLQPLTITKEYWPQYQKWQSKPQTQEFETKHQQQHVICPEHEPRSHQLKIAHPTIMLAIVRA